MGLLLDLLMTIIAEGRDFVNQSESKAICRRVRGPGRFVTVVTGIFSRIMHYLIFHTISVTLLAFIGLLDASQRFSIERSAERQRQENKKI